MPELKTKASQANVGDYLGAIDDPGRRADCATLVTLMEKVTGARATMWGASIVGFGKYRYTYESGREGEWPLCGFANRKQSLTLYVMSGFDGEATLMDKLGKHKTGKSCLYVKRLDDVDQKVLERLLKRSVAALRKRYGRA